MSIIINEYRNKSPKELKEILNDLYGKLFVLKFKISTGKTQKYSEVKKIKKDIARVSTLIKELNKNINKPINK